MFSIGEITETLDFKQCGMCAHARMQRGTGARTPPPKNDKNAGFSSNTGLIPWKIAKLPSSLPFNFFVKVGPPLTKHSGTPHGDLQRLRPACAYTQSDQSLCYSLEYSVTVKLLTEQRLEFLSSKGGCTGSPQSTLVKMPHCWKPCRGLYKQSCSKM